MVVPLRSVGGVFDPQPGEMVARVMWGDPIDRLSLNRVTRTLGICAQLTSGAGNPQNHGSPDYVCTGSPASRVNQTRGA